MRRGQRQALQDEPGYLRGAFEINGLACHFRGVQQRPRCVNLIAQETGHLWPAAGDVEAAEAALRCPHLVPEGVERLQSGKQQVGASQRP